MQETLNPMLRLQLFSPGFAGRGFLPEHWLLHDRMHDRSSTQRMGPTSHVMKLL